MQGGQGGDGLNGCAFTPRRHGACNREMERIFSDGTARRIVWSASDFTK